MTITPQAPGTAPQGPTGPQGPIGSTGASGATGPPGARRPSGPAGGIELVVCKPVLNNANNKRKPGQRCKTRLASRPIKFTTTASVRASRLRDGVVYATGAAATGRGRPQLRLRARQRICTARYTLILRRRGDAGFMFIERIARRLAHPVASARPGRRAGQSGSLTVAQGWEMRRGFSPPSTRTAARTPPIGVKAPRPALRAPRAVNLGPACPA